MQLRYGNYLHDLNEADISVSRLPEFSEGGFIKGYKETWNVNGFLQAPDANTLSQKMGALKTAYLIQNQSIALLFDNGSLTNHYLDTNACLGGIRVVDGPNFPPANGTAEYTQFRSYSIRLEGIVLALNTNVIAYHESLTFEGGGPLDIFLQTLNGLPQKQRVAQSTPYRVIQDGMALGLLGYPNVNNPIWPAALLWPRTRVSKKDPRRTGPLGAPTFTEFEITWHYEFEDSLPFVGIPTPWLA